MARKGTKDGLGEVARFNTPTQIAVSPTEVLYVSDSGNHALRQFGLDGTVSTLAGLKDSSGFRDGLKQYARFDQPLGIACDRDGNLFVADVGNCAVRLVTAEGVVTTMLVASAAPPAHQRGCLNALFSPHTLAYADGSNAVVVSDTGNGNVCFLKAGIPTVSIAIHTRHDVEVLPEKLTLSHHDWNVPQTVLARAADDGVAEDTELGLIAWRCSN
jgi:DNA-binding beta-propeller fold protein YncE